MRFDADDETDFYERRDELADQFARWLETHRVRGEPSDATLLMDWKWGYGDGDLACWRPTDVAELLLEWCPRKLSVPQEECGGLPGSVATFFRFLTASGLADARSAPLEALLQTVGT